MGFFPRCWFVLASAVLALLGARMFLGGTYNFLALAITSAFFAIVIALCIPGRHNPILVRIIAAPFALSCAAELILDFFNGSMLTWSYWDPSGFFEIVFSSKRRITEYQPMRIYFLWLSTAILVTGKWVATPAEFRRARAERSQAYSTS